MSKGNMLLGYARGKVGSMVFRRSQGEQIVSAYNGNPLNNRTTGQMRQRSTFLCASKFFTRGVQNLFKFAFEDKKQNESDFNAFMRNNAKRGIYFTRPDNEEPSYPAIGNFMMSKGRLTPPNIYLTTEDESFVINLPSTSEEGNWGSISELLIQRYGLRRGDILTVCVITANGSTTDNTPQLEPTPRGFITWRIEQAQLDTESEETIVNLFNGVLDQTRLGLVHSIEDSESNATGFVAYFSRQTNRGLNVSTSYLNLNKLGQDILTAGRTESYREQVLEYWRTTPDAILQGKQAKA